MPPSALTFRDMMAVIDAHKIPREIEVSSEQWKILMGGLQNAATANDVLLVTINGMRIVVEE